MNSAPQSHRMCLIAAEIIWPIMRNINERGCKKDDTVLLLLCVQLLLVVASVII